MNILTIVPARGGSKGVLRKNIKILGDKPLIQYPYEVAKASKYNTKIILSSEDDEIIRIGKKIGFNIPFKRPISLAKDETSTIDVLKYTIEQLIAKGQKYDICVLLQPTSPFTKVEYFDNAIEQIIQNKVNSVISIVKTSHFHPYHMFIQRNNRLFKFYKNSKRVESRFDLDEVYTHVGNIYAFKTEMILKYNKIFDKNSGFVKIKERDSINIDSNLDFIYAESILKI